VASGQWGSYLRGDADAQQLMLDCTDTLDHIWIASVAAPAAEMELTAQVREQWGIAPWFARTQARTGSLRNSYAEPGRMGVDRWLVMLGARGRERGRFCVIDAGSALTIDIVDNTGRHEGGYIIPGAALMERALLLDTERVRFDEAAGYIMAPGTSTAEAVRHGITLAQVGAITLALENSGGDPMALLYCGGAGQTLMQLVDRGGQWAPDLVFEGLEVMASLRYS
jgi:type III pantothenate kinase